MDLIEDGLSWDIYESPIGELTLVGDGERLVRMGFPEPRTALPADRRDPAALAGPVAQLEEYFAGQRTSFDIEVDLRGTDFQLSVWNALRELPFGTTVSYKALAERIGRVDRVRAVGGAVGRTPVPIVVPCHRVIGSDGSLTGYGGGIERKRALLDLEQGAMALL